MGKMVQLVDYDPAWPYRYREAVAELIRVFGSDTLELHHIGSTSVPGLISKDCVDIGGVIDQIAEIDAYTAAFRALGYVGFGECGLPGRRYFVKFHADGEDKEDLVHLHIYGQPAPEVDLYLKFRDYLRAHPDTAREYAELKRRLASELPYDRGEYSLAKGPFIRRIEALATR